MGCGQFGIVMVLGRGIHMSIHCVHIHNLSATKTLSHIQKPGCGWLPLGCLKPPAQYNAVSRVYCKHWYGRVHGWLIGIEMINVHCLCQQSELQCVQRGILRNCSSKHPAGAIC